MMAARATSNAQQTKRNIQKITTKFLAKRNQSQNLWYSFGVFHGESLVGLLGEGQLSRLA